jgi:hypothetical protein
MSHTSVSSHHVSVFYSNVNFGKSRLREAIENELSFANAKEILTATLFLTKRTRQTCSRIPDTLRLH